MNQKQVMITVNDENERKIVVDKLDPIHLENGFNDFFSYTICSVHMAVFFTCQQIIRNTHSLSRFLLCLLTSGRIKP